MIFREFLPADPFPTREICRNMAKIVQLLSLPKFRFSGGVVYLMGMRHELHEAGDRHHSRKREVRGTSVLPPSRRRLQAQVASAFAKGTSVRPPDATGALFYRSPTPSNPMISHQIPRFLNFFYLAMEAQRHRGLCSRPSAFIRFRRDHHSGGTGRPAAPASMRYELNKGRSGAGRANLGRAFSLGRWSGGCFLGRCPRLGWIRAFGRPARNREAVETGRNQGKSNQIKPLFIYDMRGPHGHAHRGMGPKNEAKTKPIWARILTAKTSSDLMMGLLLRRECEFFEFFRGGAPGRENYRTKPRPDGPSALREP